MGLFNGSGIAILWSVTMIIIFRKLFTRLGHSGWWSVTQIIPVVGLAVLAYFVFTEPEQSVKSEGPEGIGKIKPLAH